MYRIAQVVSLLSLTIVLSLSFNGMAKADLVLRIDLGTQEFDWVDGTMVTRLPTGTDNTNFGDTSSSIDARISSPLLVYVGAGTHSSIGFGISSDGSLIDRVALGSDQPPGAGASFSGTAAGPELAVYTQGSFSDFANLSLGSYDLAPVGPWDGNVQILVVSSVPEPSSLVLFMVCMAGVSARRR
ncbi:MAG: PEP-CTERM sorting domain-containing protein [Pirellulaceae bacterium]|nr:PEP-CTERM sorting domain-containing protein [Pirellulaceae bacterium]